MATEPSPLQRELIFLALTQPTATKESLAKALDISADRIRYHLEATRNKHWLPADVVEGILRRSCPTNRNGGRPPGSNNRPYHRHNVWADRIVELLQRDSGAVERLANFLPGGVLEEAQ